MSNRAALFAVLVAFSVGVIASLALRPPTRVAGARAESRAQSVRWRMPVAFGTNLPALGDNAPEVVRAIVQASDGSFQVEVFEPGELVPPFSIVDAVRQDKVESGYTWLGYDQGKLPASVLFGAVPFGMTPWEYSAWWYEGGGEVLAREIYEGVGVRPLLCGLIGPETAGWFRSEIRTPEDLVGLKIRFAGLGGKAVQRVGASVTMLPGGQIFQALEKGAIDATEFSLPVVDQRLGFDRVARFNYFPGWHQPFTALHLVVGSERWRGLEPWQRSLVETACASGVARNFARAEALQGPVIEAMAARGIRTEVLSDDVLAALETASVALLEEEAEADADFARVLESQRRFRAAYETWRRFAYPARR